MNLVENLTGKVLNGGWVITEKKSRPRISSGGNFSVGYIVERNGNKAFLKALDITRAFRFADFTRALENLLKAHNYECDLLEKCMTNRLTKIVNVLDKGQIEIEQGSSPIPIPPIPYIIFELAETNSREILNEIEEFDIAFALRSLHNIAIGLKQLHWAGLVHQDLKPSNVLHFDEKRSSKLGDLGRGDTEHNDAPHSKFNIAGDPSYAPPELLYKDGSFEFDRRRACDTYHLGSLLMYYFTQSDTTAMIKSYLPSDFHWDNWGGSYSEVLPYVYEAFDKSVLNFVDSLRSKIEDEKAINELEWCLRRLCDPDPIKRGHPKDIESVGSSYSLERFITIFNRWATAFENNLAR